MIGTRDVFGRCIRRNADTRIALRRWRRAELLGSRILCRFGWASCFALIAKKAFAAHLYTQPAKIPKNALFSGIYGGGRGTGIQHSPSSPEQVSALPGRTAQSIVGA